MREARINEARIKIDTVKVGDVLYGKAFIHDFSMEQEVIEYKVLNVFVAEKEIEVSSSRFGIQVLDINYLTHLRSFAEDSIAERKKGVPA